jgi:hypothetical protein
MKAMKQWRAACKPLLCATCIALVLVAAGCKDDSGASATTAPAAAAAGGDTNSAPSTNATAPSTTQ